METVKIEGIELVLSHPDSLGVQWVGQEFVQQQLRAAWMKVDPDDIPLNPRILGRPGVGKTALAYATAQALGRDVYLVQATMDTRPEDLLITPVLGEGGGLKYVAGGLVTAMLKGGVCVLDEGNRMTEKSWASLAPLLDGRRYIESLVAGVKVKAHPDFLFCSTMNEDASTFEIPEYIQSRLQPRIVLEFPDRSEELAIMRANMPGAPADLLAYVVDFLQRAHDADENYTVRDGVNVARYALKLRAAQDAGDMGPLPAPVSAGRAPASPAGLRSLEAGDGFDLQRWFHDALEGALRAGDPEADLVTPEDLVAATKDVEDAAAETGGSEQPGRLTKPAAPPPRSIASVPRARSAAPPWDGCSLAAAVRHAASQILGEESLSYLDNSSV